MTYFINLNLWSFEYQRRNYFILLLENDPIGFKSPALVSYFMQVPLNNESKLIDANFNKYPCLLCFSNAN